MRLSRSPKFSSLFIIGFLGFSTVFFFGCVTIDPDYVEVIDAETFKSRSAIVGDTFNLVYVPPAGIDSLTAPPEAVYTFNFWQPEFFESGTPQVRRVTLENYRNLYYFARVPIPSTAQLFSYYVKTATSHDSLATESFPVLLRTGRPTRAAQYRVANAMRRSRQPTDSVLAMLRAETTAYPDNYDAWLVYWSLWYEQMGRTDAALATIEQEMSELRRRRRDESSLLEAIALTYIYGIGDRRKGYEVTRDIPDTYLHPLNLYNRFLIEADADKRELALSAMLDKYPAHPLTPKMHLSHLLFYLSNQKLYRERGAIFCENLLNRRLAALRASRVNTYAIRYLFDYYANIDLAKAMPYVQDVLRLDYDRDVYDPVTLLEFSERFAASRDYAGLAIDLAGKAIQAVDADKQKPLQTRPESEFIPSEASRKFFQQDLTGRAYFCIGRAYRTIGDNVNALANLREARKTCISRQAEIFYEFARAFESSNSDSSLYYALKSLALNFSSERYNWCNDTFFNSKKAKAKKGESLDQKLAAIRREGNGRASEFSLVTLDGKTVSLASLPEKIVVLYVWSPNSMMSKAALSDIQLLHAKYRARGAEFFAIDADDGLKSVRASPAEYAFSFAFAVPNPSLLVDYQLSYLPSIVMIKNGRILYRRFGYDKNFIASIESEIQTMLLGDAATQKESDKPSPKKRLRPR
ncbi:MAG: hypothetical protein HY22_09885 [[Candidatus Thermochlorobacteriaceae] bacterium GBChlB]|nr:MAG: hypothetical protein HY22_09885 [[Candidatus Thermochlorobacteriaceae] bacterium GBChlB]